MIRIVPRHAFPTELRGWFSGGQATYHYMTGRCWAGRTGAALIAWDYSFYVRGLA